MARNRTVKPAFFDDETLGGTAVASRLLFISCWLEADDEGLLRWTAPSLKAAAFKYDDFTTADVTGFMRQLTAASRVITYSVNDQQYGWIPTFVKHQPAGRPVRSQLPPPPLNDPGVVRAYARRDKWVCGACGGTIDPQDVAVRPVKSYEDGGTDHPRNIQAVHPGCVKSLPVRPAERSPAPFVQETLPDMPSPPVAAPPAAVPLASRVETRSQAIIGAWIDGCKARPPEKIIARVGKAVKELLSDGLVPADISNGLTEWQERGLDPSAIASVVNMVINGDHRSTADRRVADGMALAEHYREQGE
jgi:hypothetical protein